MSSPGIMSGVNPETNNQGFSSWGSDDGTDRSKVFDAIDAIRELQVGDISLPQLVAVGDQSSGKSSLLESITGISFPVDSQLCTRFATQIMLRRTDLAKEFATVQATIRPGASSLRDAELKMRLESFNYSYKESEFGPKEFQEVLAKAEKIMGIGPDKRFSDDVLKIEISGCHQPHLTIVDVPGLFRNSTVSQSRQEIPLVRNMIDSYVKDRRTIIMAVVDGTQNLALQDILDLVQDADPAGDRTIGVITKCDAVQPGDEKGVLNIARNMEKPLRHGWFVVKNRSTIEHHRGMTMQQREEREKEFFSRAPWNCLDPSRVGIKNLEEFVSGLLYQHIQDELPTLSEEINEIIMRSRAELKALGTSRADINAQRYYLTMIAKQYDNFVTSYLDSRTGNILYSGNPLKIRANVRNLNDKFVKDMKARGQTRPFRGSDGIDSEKPGSRPTTVPLNESVDDSFDAEGGSVYDLKSTLSNPKDFEQEPRDILQWIRMIYRNSRGTELQLHMNPFILVEIFREQAKNWRVIANDYVHAVVQTVERFSDALLTEIVAEETVRSRIRMKLAKQTTERIIAAYQRLAEVIEDEFDGILQTLDEDLQRLYDRAQARRILDRPSGDEPTAVPVDGTKPSSSSKRLRPEDVIVKDIHDSLKAFYPIALKRFVATVNIQVVERKLLREDGPIRLFHPGYVAQLSEKELEDITKEDAKIGIKRKELESRLKHAEHAQEVVKSIQR